jgi:hypothetical protein
MIEQGTLLQAFTEFGLRCDRGDYIKPSVAFKMLGLKSVSLLYYHIEAGNLPALKVGGTEGHIWIPRTELEMFAEQYGFRVREVKERG